MTLDRPEDYPDFSAAEIPFERLDSLLAERGVVVIRQLIPLPLIDVWLPRFVQAFQAADTQVYTGQMSLALYRGLYRYGHVYPPTIPDYDQWHTSLLAYAPFRQVLRSFFGDRCALMVKNSYPRRQGRARPEHAIGWHQDQEFLGALPAINTWIPLTLAGGDYPGVEFELPSGEHWIPELVPGDLLIFHAYTRHRTFLPVDSQQERISSELRWLATSGFAYANTPLLEVNLREAPDDV